MTSYQYSQQTIALSTAQSDQYMDLKARSRYNTTAQLSIVFLFVVILALLITGIFKAHHS